MDEEAPPPFKRAPSDRNRKSKKALGLEKRKELYVRQLKEFNVQRPASAVSAKNVQTMRQLKELLRQTWERNWDNMQNWSRLSDRQINFAREYAISGRRGKARAAQRAGYKSQGEQDLINCANANLRTPFFDELIQAFEIEEKARMGLKIQDVADWYEKIATAALEAGDFSAANRAMELYGKYLGMFVEKKEITHKTLYTKDEVNSRIAELSAILKESEPDIAAKLTIN